MREIEPITIAAAVNDDDVLRANLLASPGLFDTPGVDLMVQRGGLSASLAHNASLDQAATDLVMLVHQDVYFPRGWLEGLQRSLEWLARRDPDWGVLGCFGVRRGQKAAVGRIFSTGWGDIGLAPDVPQAVDTLDEIVLLTRRSTGLRFDPALPHFHLYGTDLCLAARDAGRASYVLPGYCVHNTHQILSLPEDFYACYRHIKRKWPQYLPIRTPCVTISRLDLELRWQRTSALRRRLLGRSTPPARRLADPRVVLAASAERS